MKKRKNLHTKIFHLFVIFSYYRAPYFHAILITGTTENRLSPNEAGRISVTIIGAVLYGGANNCRNETHQ